MVEVPISLCIVLMQLSFGLTRRFQFATRGNHLWFLLGRTKGILAVYAAICACVVLRR